MAAARRTKTHTSRPGQVTVRGDWYYWWNAGDEAARIMIEVRPPSRFEAMIDALFAMARDGQTDGKGVPQPHSRLEAFAKEFSDVIVLTGRDAEGG